MSWLEVGDKVFCRRYEPWDVTVGVVVGSAGVLVIDTRASEEEASELVDDLRSLDRRPPRWVVNTHSHFDHVKGNERLRPVEVWGHRSLRATVATPVDQVVDDSAVLDLGDRTVVLRYLGPAHTAGDLVVHVPEAGVVFTGDLVEESGPPDYGDDSYPLAWPEANRRLLDLVAGNDRVVPGHGAVVDRQFVAAQRDQLQTVAGLIRELRAGGVPVEAAVAAGGDRWPFPPTCLGEAVSRGYAELGSGG